MGIWERFIFDYKIKMKIYVKHISILFKIEEMVMIKLVDGDKEYKLFGLREKEIVTYENFETTIFILRECRKYFSKGESVCGKLNEFFSRLSYMHFNYLVFHPLDEVLLKKIETEPVLSIDGILYKDETDHEFDLKVLYYLMKKWNNKFYNL